MQAQGEEKKIYKKRSRNWAGGFPSLDVFWVSLPWPRGYIFLCLPNKTSVTPSRNTGLFITSNFCCSENRGNYKLPGQLCVDCFHRQKLWTCFEQRCDMIWLTSRCRVWNILWGSKTGKARLVKTLWDRRTRNSLVTSVRVRSVQWCGKSLERLVELFRSQSAACDACLH